MKKVLVCICLSFVACSTPTAPTKPQTMGEYITETLVAVGPTGRSSISDLQGKIDHVYDDSASAWIRNTGPAALDVFLVARKFESPGGSDQSVFDFQVSRLESGTSTRLSIRLSGCQDEIELGRGNEAVIRAWVQGQPLVDVVYAGGSCFVPACPESAPVRRQDGTCGLDCGPGYHQDQTGACVRDTPPQAPTPPPPEPPDDDDGTTPPPDNPPDDDDNTPPPPPPPVPPICGLNQHVLEGICVCDEGYHDDPRVDGLQCTLIPPPAAFCFYEIAKPKAQKQAYCESKGGTFSSHDGSDHCIFSFPGISDGKLNLAPGLSAPGCLRKQDN